MALLHAAWGYLFNCIGTRWLETRIHPEAAMMLLSNVYGPNNERFDTASVAVLGGWHPFYLATYFATICIAAGMLGWGFRELIDATRIDRWIPLLRANDWYYLLNGETPDGQPLGEGDEGVQFTAVVGDHIYWGLIYDYFVSPGGSLDAVVLAIPKRRKLGEGEVLTGDDPPVANPKPPFHEIDVHYLVLKCSECTNFGIRLVALPLANGERSRKRQPLRWLGVKLKQLGHALSRPPFSEPY